MTRSKTITLEISLEEIADLKMLKQRLTGGIAVATYDRFGSPNGVERAKDRDNERQLELVEKILKELE